MATMVDTVKSSTRSICFLIEVYTSYLEQSVVYSIDS